MCGCAPGVSSGYYHHVSDGFFQVSDLLHVGVLAARGLAVEEGLAVEVDLQSSVVNGSDGNGELALKLDEKLSRYPSGLW